jgi:hypothetical protein
MKEKTVFWVETQPLPERKVPSLAGDEGFVATSISIIESAGCDVNRPTLILKINRLFLDCE